MAMIEDTMQGSAVLEPGFHFDQQRSDLSTTINKILPIRLRLVRITETGSARVLRNDISWAGLLTHTY
jgi:hypothetical protein